MQIDTFILTLLGVAIVFELRLAYFKWKYYVPVVNAINRNAVGTAAFQILLKRQLKDEHDIDLGDSVDLTLDSIDSIIEEARNGRS